MNSYEYVVIVKLTPQTAHDLNHYQGNNGLDIHGRGVLTRTELNQNNPTLHDHIQSRVFTVKAIQGSAATVDFNGKTEHIIFPNHKEYIEVEL